MAISLPTAADVRKVRSQANQFVSDQLDVVRTPVLAWLGAGDLAVHTLRELPERLSRDTLRRRADKASEQARETYRELTERGEVTLERIRSRPEVARALRTVENVNQRSNSVVEKVVDELHDAGEDALQALSVETRSAGEKAARRAQRVAGETAATVSEAGDELAESIREAGDEAAHDTRGATRRAANRAAPAKPANGARNARNAPAAE